VFLLLFKIIRHRCLALTLLGALALAGCSAVRFGYEQAPSLTYWWLDGQLDFSSEQTPRVRDTLERLQRWHRRHELRPYADLLARAASLAEGTVTTEQACQLTQEVQESLNVFMRETLRLAAPVAVTIDQRQIRHLGQHQEQKNTAWEEQWLQGSEASRLQYRLDKLVDRYADFYGKLSDAQVKLLRQQLEQSVWSPQWGRQERLRQQRDLLNALMRIEQDKPGVRQTEELLLGVWARWMRPPSEVDRQRWQNWQEQGCKQMAELHNSTSAEQRQRAARRLRTYEADFRELASRP
jgi:Family of unknown function (DUF6279)